MDMSSAGVKPRRKELFDIWRSTSQKKRLKSAIDFLKPFYTNELLNDEDEKQFIAFIKNECEKIRQKWVEKRRRLDLFRKFYGHWLEEEIIYEKKCPISRISPTPNVGRPKKTFEKVRIYNKRAGCAGSRLVAGGSVAQAPWQGSCCSSATRAAHERCSCGGTSSSRVRSRSPAPYNKRAGCAGSRLVAGGSVAQAPWQGSCCSSATRAAHERCSCGGTSSSRVRSRSPAPYNKRAGVRAHAWWRAAAWRRRPGRAAAAAARRARRTSAAAAAAPAAAACAAAARRHIIREQGVRAHAWWRAAAWRRRPGRAAAAAARRARRTSAAAAAAPAAAACAAAARRHIIRERVCGLTLGGGRQRGAGALAGQLLQQRDARGARALQLRRHQQQPRAQPQPGAI
ncbi:hypothetical protein ACJJTC_000046 [Scirpophaga incertulas]